jgi:hypothetical protein
LYRLLPGTLELFVEAVCTSWLMQLDIIIIIIIIIIKLPN